MTTALSVRNQDSYQAHLPLPASGELEPGRLVNIVSGAPAYTDAGDVPLGQVREPVSATDTSMPRERRTPITLVSGGSMLTLWCDDAVSLGDLLYTAADGKVSTTASNCLVGEAISTKSAGEGFVTVAPRVVNLA